MSKTIGIMLRTIEERQGIGIYTRGLMDALLPMDTQNKYVLFFKTPKFMGHYTHLDHVTERLIEAPNKMLWDQLYIPLAARREKLDLLFHTKFTVPFLASCPCTMSIHGASWFVHPELYENKLDLAYIKLMMPWYCRKSVGITSNSQLTTDDFVRILNVPASKIRTIHLGRNESFKTVEDTAELERVASKYPLPKKYIFSVVKYDPRKNFKNLIAAFRELRKELPEARLVVAGIGCEKYIEEEQMDADGTSEAVTFLGWVEPEDLPALYTKARCMFFPSVYEEFGIPTVEALACGCPPVVSSTGALPEIAGDAGFIVDPFDPPAMAKALKAVYTDDALYAECREKALKRAEQFSWKRCAEGTLKLFNDLLENPA